MLSRVSREEPIAGALIKIHRAMREWNSKEHVRDHGAHFSLRQLSCSDFWLFRKKTGLVPAIFDCRLVCRFVDKSMQSFAQHSRLGFFAFRIRKIRWLRILSVALQIEPNEAIHG
jgi:hypothetical protein